MSLFDRASSSQGRVGSALSPGEAFAVISLISIAWDGNLPRKQTHNIYEAMSHLKLFNNCSEDDMLSMFETLCGIIRHEGVNNLFDAAKDSLTEDLREAAFAVATDLVLADSMLGEDEDFLRELYQALRIPGDIGQKIIEVMLIKNRG
ncbi:MAG: tellurite resistance TerB family protein [Cyanobacteria bacterium P01_D01_bin.50]